MLFADSFYNSYPNLPAYWALGDRAGSVTGLGGNVADTRYFTRPAGYPEPVYPLATQEENNSPNGLSQWNPMGIGVFDFSNNGVTDPALIAKGNQIAYQYGADLVLDMQFKNACQSLSSLQSQLEGAVKSDKLDEAQKQKLQEVIDEIKALKEEVTEKAKSGNLKREEKEAVMGQIQELTEKASKAADEVIAEVKEKAENGEGSDDKVDDKDDDKTEGAGSTKSDEEVKKQDKKNKDEAAGIVGLIFEAVDGIGTNNEQVNQAIEQINKDNIIDVFDTWNKNYKAKEGSLVKRLYEEEFWYNGGNKNVETMLAIFEEKAKELDIYSELIKETLILTVAVAVIAAAVFFFLVPSHASVSSISGLGIVLSNFIPMPLSAITMILNVLLLIIGFFTCGKEFGIKTVYTSIMLPLFLGLFEFIFPENTSMTGSQELDVLCYILVVSIGLSILFNRNASSGGLDIVAKIMNKYLHMELGKAMSLSGMCVALSAALVYDKKTVVLSILGTYFNGIILDHFIFNHNIKRRVCIITEKEAELRQFILNDLHSGATIYESIGAYNMQKRNEIITIVDKSEYQKLMNYMSHEDPLAFITVYNVSDMRYQPKR